MKESRFVGENSEKWEELESIINQNDKNPDKLSDLYVQLTDDLSYARTFYRNRSIRVYLNGLTQKLLAKIQKRPRFKLQMVIDFFKEDIPRLMYTGRKEMFLSLGMFLFAILIGVFSSIQDPQFPNLVLGDYYVEMTKRNIENNDPMAVYRTGTEVEGFFQILINNARIDILVFSAGLLFSVFSIFILVSNGIMLGTFQYFFYAFGGFSTSLVTIWLHGTIEISTIVLAGGAGLMAGRGWLVPGTYSRLQAFRISSMRGVKMLMAILPFTVLAAFIESFITRMWLPVFIKIMVIGASLAIMILYFVVYPYRKFSRIAKVHKEEEDQLPHRKERIIETNTIKTVGEMVMDTVYVYRRKFRQIILISVLATAVYQITAFFLFPNYVRLFVFRPTFAPIQWLVEFFGVEAMSFKAYLYRANTGYFNFVALLVSLVAALSAAIASRSEWFKNSSPKIRLDWLLAPAIFFLTMQILKPYNLFLNMILGFVWLMANAFVHGLTIGSSKKGLSLGDELSLVFQGLKKLFGMGTIFAIFTLLSLLLAATPISFFNQIFIQELIQLSPDRLRLFNDIFVTSMHSLILFAVLPLFAYGALFWRDSLVEERHALQLKRDIQREFGLEE